MDPNSHGLGFDNNNSGHGHHSYVRYILNAFVAGLWYLSLMAISIIAISFSVEIIKNATSSLGLSPPRSSGQYPAATVSDTGQDALADIDAGNDHVPDDVFMNASAEFDALEERETTSVRRKRTRASRKQKRRQDASPEPTSRPGYSPRSVHPDVTKWVIDDRNHDMGNNESPVKENSNGVATSDEETALATIHVRDARKSPYLGVTAQRTSEEDANDLKAQDHLTAYTNHVQVDRDVQTPPPNLKSPHTPVRREGIKTPSKNKRSNSIPATPQPGSPDLQLDYSPSPIDTYTPGKARPDHKQEQKPNQQVQQQQQQQKPYDIWDIPQGSSPLSPLSSVATNSSTRTNNTPQISITSPIKTPKSKATSVRTPPIHSTVPRKPRPGDFVLRRRPKESFLQDTCDEDDFYDGPFKVLRLATQVPMEDTVKFGKTARNLGATGNTPIKAKGNSNATPTTATSITTTTTTTTTPQIIANIPGAVAKLDIPENSVLYKSTSGGWFPLSTLIKFTGNEPGYEYLANAEDPDAGPTVLKIDGQVMYVIAKVRGKKVEWKKKRGGRGVATPGGSSTTTGAAAGSTPKGGSAAAAAGRFVSPRGGLEMVVRYKVHWKGYLCEDDTWEMEEGNVKGGVPRKEIEAWEEREREWREFRGMLSAGGKEEEE